MKTLVVVVLSLLGFNYSFANPGDEREMVKGTVLNYTVKDGNVSYKLKATIIVWNPELNVQIQWQTTGAKVMKGTTTFPYSALESAEKMKMRLKAGKEELPVSFTRLFIGFDTYDYLHTGIEADIEIDDKKITFTPDEDETTKEILFNNVKTEMDFAMAEAGETNSTTTIGIIEYAPSVIILSEYSSGNFSMNLVSIQAPKKALTLEEKMAKDILDAMAPKGKVPLKKMEPAKFAKVKSSYPLLATIEDYDATKGGKVKKPITETYEYRYGSSSPNPPSLIDCFTADLKVIFNQSTNFGLSDIGSVGGRSLPSSSAKKLMEVYINKDYNSIPGYRPWTHWSFVRGLTEAQRTQLAKELQGYVAEYGFSE